MCEKLEIGFRGRFFYSKEFFPKILISKNCVKMKLRLKTKKYAVDSEIEFPTKSNFRDSVSTETTRERGS